MNTQRLVIRFTPVFICLMFLSLWLPMPVKADAVSFGMCLGSQKGLLSCIVDEYGPTGLVACKLAAGIAHTKADCENAYASVQTGAAAGDQVLEDTVDDLADDTGELINCALLPAACILKIIEENNLDDPALTRMAVLSGNVLLDAGVVINNTVLGETAIFISDYNAVNASENCRLIVSNWYSRFAIGSSLATLPDVGPYRIVVPACGPVTYTLKPINPLLIWTPSARQVTVGAGAGVGASSISMATNNASSGLSSGAVQASAQGTQATRQSEKKSAQSSNASGGGKYTSAPSFKGTPDIGVVAVDLTVGGRDADSLSSETDGAVGPARGTPRPGYAELENRTIDALWRATTGCDSLGEPLAGPTPAELAACGEKSVNQRLQTAQQGRNDFNDIFGIGSSTSSGLAGRAAGDRGLPTLTTDSNGHAVLPSQDEILSYLTGLQSQYSSDPTADDRGPGMTKKEAEEKLSYIGSAIKWTGIGLKKVYGLAGKVTGTVMEHAGKFLEEELPVLATPFDIYRTGTSDKVTKDDATANPDINKNPNPDDDRPVQFTQKQCRAICNGESGGYAERQQCGCDDSSQGVKNPSTTEGTGTMNASGVDGTKMMKKKIDPLIHTSGPEVEQAPVEINQIPDGGGKGPNPDPVKGNRK